MELLTENVKWFTRTFEYVNGIYFKCKHYFWFVLGNALDELSLDEPLNVAASIDKIGDGLDTDIPFSSLSMNIGKSSKLRLIPLLHILGVFWGDFSDIINKWINK